MKVSISIIPNSSKNQIVGWQEQYLKIKIAAPPEKGKANKELIAFLAKEWDIAKRSIQIVKGETNRKKVIEIIGTDKLPLPENPQKTLL